MPMALPHSAFRGTWKLGVGSCLFCVVALALGVGVGAQNWPQWRGPARDGHIEGFRAPAAWPKELTKRWTLDVGAGYATPLVVADRVYIFTRQGENEVMRALDSATGRELWRTSYAAP